MNKFLGIIFIYVLFSPLFIIAANNTMIVTSSDAITQQIIQSEQNVKAYFNKEFTKLQTDISTKSNAFIDEKVTHIDLWISSEFKRYYIKILIGFVAGLFFSSMIIYFVILSVRKLLHKKSVTERQVVMQWLEAHEIEAITMKKTIAEMESFIDLLKGIKSKSPEILEVPKPPNERVNI